ncbi:protein hook homolog isoform X1 [Mercenaria mercenaria]|uniref:protein hook homolog isoform X1 n=1 Tax=Mercenaria mercenaria TaxID=6596 RepID=UPI00234F4CB3|nr:protein hook homolog isoform X1 [Mercenaria mercenaria]
MHTVLANMDIIRMKSVLVCVTCIVLMPGHACELDSDVVFKIFDKLDEVMKEQRDLRHSLDVAVSNMRHQTNRMTNVDEITNKMENQADKVAALEESINKINKYADRITNLDETTSKIEMQANKISSLEEATNKMKKQADRITQLEEIVNNIENKPNGVTSVENEVQKLNNRVAKLENSTLNNEKAILDVTRLVTENDMKAVAKISESSINAIKHDVLRQSVAVRKMASAEKMLLRGKQKSLDEKFLNFTNEVKLQISTMNVSVESQISSFETKIVSIERSQETLQQTAKKELDHHTKTLNKANENIQQLTTRNRNIETRLETLREKTDKVSDNHKVILTKVNGDIQGLQTRIAKVEESQETLREKTDKESDNHKTILTKANGDIQGLQTRIAKVEGNQETLREKTDKESDNYKTILTKANGDIQGLQKRIAKVEENQETLREKTDKESDNHKTILTKANGDIQGLQTRIGKVEENQGLQQKPIAFLAEITNSISGSSFRVYFQNVKLNLGNSYIPHHGLFIAPVNGTYLFSVSACSKAGRYITLSIVAKNSAAGHLLAGCSSITDCNSKDFLLWLQAGDDVYIRHSGEGDYLFANSKYGYPTFSGVLVHAD